MPPTKTTYMQALNDYLVVKEEIVEEKRSAGGIIINVSSVFDFGDLFSKKNVVKAEVVFANSNIPFLRPGDKIVFNPNKGTRITMEWEELHIITSEQYIAKVDKDGKYIVPPDCVMLKIYKADKDSLFSKWIVKNDGTKVQLFIQPEPDKDSTQRSKIFVSVSEVVQVGSDVKGIKEKDIAILDYVIDNDIDNILDYDDEGNKFIVIQATTVLHKHDEWAYATRDSPKDQKVAAKGDIQTISPILGVIRHDELIARFPYVFLEHKPTKVEKQTEMGISYTEHEYILRRKVLSVSEESHKRYGINENQIVLLQDPDIFDVQLKDSKVQCVIDSDVMLGFK